MARIILDVPTEKIKLFIELLMRLGIDKHSIASSFDEEHLKQLQKGKIYRSLAKNFKLPGWEFFCNELEFE